MKKKLFKMTALEMAGISISVLILDGGSTKEEILWALDAPVSALGWPKSPSCLDLGKAKEITLETGTFVLTTDS